MKKIINDNLKKTVFKSCIIIGLIIILIYLLRMSCLDLSNGSVAEYETLDSSLYDDFEKNTNMKIIINDNNNMYYQFIDNELKIKEIVDSIYKKYGDSVNYYTALADRNEKVNKYLYKKYEEAKKYDKILLVLINKGYLDDSLYYKKKSKKLKLVLKKRRYEYEVMSIYTIILDDKYEIEYKEG